MAVSTVYTDRDCEIRSGWPTTNYPSVHYIPTYTVSGYYYSIVLGFNIASEPSAAQITSVTLHNYGRQKSGSSTANVIARMTNDNWVETYPTWNNTSITTTNQITNGNWPALNTWLSYDITNMYKDAKNAGMSILGFRLTNPNDGTNAIYARESGVEKSYITITYTTAKPIKINIGDSWKDATAMKINIGDSWKDVVSVKQNIGDTWKTVF